MSGSLWDIKGAECIRGVFGRLGDTNKLKQGFENAGGKKDGKVDSCSQTMRVLGLALGEITGKGFTPVQGLNKLSQVKRVNKVADLLGRPRALFIDVTPDHHFVVLSVSPTQVVIMQSYEESYNFLEWSRSEAAAYRKLSVFLEDLKGLVSTNKGTNSEAAVRLFGFGGHKSTVRNIYMKSNGPSEILTVAYMDIV